MSDKYPPKNILPPRDGKYDYEERAAIIEYDGKLPRNAAEFLAAKVHQKTPAQRSVFYELEM